MTPVLWWGSYRADEKMDKPTLTWKNKDFREDHLVFKKCQNPVLTKEEKRKRAWLKEGSKLCTALVSIVKKKALLNIVAFLKIFATLGVLKVFISCSINTLLKRYKVPRLKDCFKQLHSKVTEIWYVKKVLCQKLCNYIENLETTAHAQKMFPKDC